MWRLFLFLSGCVYDAISNQPVKQHDKECDQFKIGPVVECVGLESFETLRCEYETDCRDLHMICDGRGNCYKKGK